MASKKYLERQERKKNVVRIVAIVIAVALLLSTFLVFFAGLR